jgi:lysophospholipase L1-like esterase
MLARAFRIVAINLMVFVGILLSVELALQGIALTWPSYEVLFLQPDRALGWKQVPNFQWRWAGHHWYAADFSVPVRTNANGFRDLDRATSKQDGTRRVALLGDSFIEAVQVPFESTAGQRLQQMLNASSSAAPVRWEVLNFGISNYGVGQYLLTWDEYVHRYRPDYVAIFVAGLHMRRTVARFEQGAFPASRESLWVRPTFRIEGDRLVEEPARDFEEFVRVQNAVNHQDFGGQRSRIRRELITLRYGRQLARLVGDRVSAKAPSSADAGLDGKTLEVNRKIIEELGRRVAGSGGKLIVLDVSRYFGDPDAVSQALRRMCEANRFDYIAVYEDLLRANANGVSTRWRNDGHLNIAGNEILAGALLRSLERDAERRP